MYPILKSANDQQTAENQKAFNDITFSQTLMHGSGAVLTGAAIANELNPATAAANVLLLPPTFGGHAYLAKKNTDITAMINTNNFVDQLRKVVAVEWSSFLRHLTPAF